MRSNEMSMMTAVPAFSTYGGALIASPSSSVRERVLRDLNGRCLPVQQALGGAEALVKLEKGNCQVLFIDRRLPDLDAEELIAVIQRRFPGVQVVQVDSDEDGAAPAEAERQMFVVERGEPVRSVEPARNLSRSPNQPLPGMIGTSPVMQDVYRMVRLVAPRTTTVLIAGPTGSGKELVARALHGLSPRASKRLVVVNCAAIPETLLESELFGYSRGAFTGAVQAQTGRISSAHGGTLFLDEVGELPLGMQGKLLRFLEQKEIQRLGTSEVTPVDVRVLAASNADLARRAAGGQFREDLFYRLSAFPITLPALAQRRDDIIPLAQHFLECMATAMGMPCPRLSSEAMRALEDYPWKGNVRELQHVIERASILVEQGDTVLAEHLYFSYFQTSPREPELLEATC
jgi:DNA-binding NtrC family response regulator